MATKICLDAGHYAKYNRSPVIQEYYESDMNWKLHLLLKKHLEQYGFEVITTRADKDKDLSLYNRGATAKGCDLFMSLHSNAAYSTKEYKENGNTHKNEYVDRVDIFAPIDGRAHDIAQKLADVIAEVMGTNQGGNVKTREHKGGEYYGVIRGAVSVGVPGLLVEHSFHTNARAARWLLDDANLDRLAQAEARVLAEHFGMSGQTVNENSGLTEITGRAKATAQQMTAYIRAKNPSVAQSVLDMIPLYLSEGAAEGIRGDIAFAQSCLETGNFGFEGSAVTLDQNNFCGMGVTSNGIKGNSFDTPQQGIRAQIQHLKAYANNEALNNECVDPRFDYVVRGSARYIDWLGVQENPNGKGWASGAGYGEKILGILANILATNAETTETAHLLRRGDRGEEVKAAQRLLLKWDAECLPEYGADGDFGSETERAVREYQEEKGLKIDGIIGPKTLEALLTISANPYKEPSKNIKKGFSGNGVRWVQWELLRHDKKCLPKYGIDGDFGNETLKAVKAFQGAHNLKTDGIVGKLTRAALKNA